MSQFTEIKSWWKNLNEREQLTLMIGLAAGVVMLFYLLVWSPTSNKVNAFREKIAWQQSALTSMESDIVLWRKYHGKTKTSETRTKGSLVSIVSNGIDKSALASFAPEIGQVERSKVRVKFANVPFDQLIQWLSDLWQKEHIRIVSFSVTPQEEAVGYVQATVVVE